MSYFFWLGIEAEKHELIPFASLNDFTNAIDPELIEDDGDVTLYASPSKSWRVA